MTAVVPPHDVPPRVPAEAPPAPPDVAPHAIPALDEPDSLSGQFLLRATIFGLVVLVGTPAVLQRIAPYWWVSLTAIPAAAATILALLLLVAHKATTAWIRRTFLDGPYSVRNVIGSVAACVLVCAAFFLYLPKPDAPFLRIMVLNDVQWDLLHGSVLQVTATKPGKQPESFLLPLDGAEAWYVGWPEARLSWAEEGEGGRKAAIKADALSLLKIRNDGGDYEAGEFADRWRKAKTLRHDLPPKTKVSIALGRIAGGRFVASEQVGCYDKHNGDYNPLEVGDSGLHNLFVGRRK
jgi:hypothetical protein